MLSFHINTFFIVNEMCLPISVQDIEAFRGNRVMSFSRPRHPIKPQKPIFLILCHFPLTLQLQHYNYLHALQLL